jgi:hypothetical protein
MSNLANLHEIDLNLWLEQMAIAVKNRDVNNMDWDNLLEEIEDMGASQKRALESYMQRLIEHILKLQYWYLEVERCRNGWQQEVTNYRSGSRSLLLVVLYYLFAIALDDLKLIKLKETTL